MYRYLLVYCISVLTSFTLQVSAQSKVQHEVWSSFKYNLGNNHSIQSFADADSLWLGQESESLYYGTRFGNGLLVAVQLPEFNSDSVSIYGLQLHFYGGRTIDRRDLGSARIRAMLWTNKDTSQAILPGNSSRSSANADVNLTAEEIRPVYFSFTDTSIVNPTNSWIGIRYENSSDSINAVSPIFYSSPVLYESLFYRTVEVDSARTDTVRQNHARFWNNPDSIGGMWGWILYKNKKKQAVQQVSLERISLMPHKLRLHAYPNPFNPTVSLEILPEQTGEIQIEIVNFLGQRVHERSIRVKSGITAVYRWDAGTLPSGIYFAKIRQNNTIQVTKLTLLK